MEALKTVAVWGDSLAKGVIWNAERGRHGYCAEPAARVAGEKLGIRVVNRAHFGYTATQGLERLEHDLDEGLSCDAAVLEFGGNDCNFDWAAISADPGAPHEPATPAELFVRTLRRMVRRLYDRGVRPILTTLPPIDAERYFRFFVGNRLNGESILKWLGDVHQIYRFHEMYSLLVEKVGRELQTRVLDLRTRCLARKGYLSCMLCEDGLHLTEEGQRFVGEQIADMALEEG
ncbi:MAG: GDSL-type esterase/lipase family protein [Clostridia bacterium]|nr:GDSL-type esterase/lipase family protein [Clostridia bacterium]